MCPARSSRDGVVYAMAPQLVLRIAAGRGSDSGAGVTSKATRSPLRDIKGVARSYSCARSEKCSSSS